MRPKENKFQKAQPTLPLMNDKNGQALAYVYYEEEPGRRAAANLLARDEARRIALNIANYFVSSLTRELA